MPQIGFFHQPKSDQHDQANKEVMRSQRIIGHDFADHGLTDSPDRRREHAQFPPCDFLPQKIKHPQSKDVPNHAGDSLDKQGSGVRHQVPQEDFGIGNDRRPDGGENKSFFKIGHVRHLSHKTNVVRRVVPVGTDRRGNIKKP